MQLRSSIRVALLFFSFVNAEEYLISAVGLPKQSRTDVTVIEAIDDFNLIIGNAETRRYLSSRGIEHAILDTDPRQKTGSYFLVTPIAESVETIRSVSMVLARYEHIVVVYVPSERQDAFLKLRVERALITFDPFLFNDTVPDALSDRPVRRLDIIQEIVDKVSKDSLRSYIRALQKFDRTAKSTENATKMAPWIQQKFKDLGVDTVYLQPASGCGPNVVAIIRGTEPDQKKYCIIGGHSDAVVKYAGADDNGSGAAATLEAARVLSEYKFQNTIRFVAFNGEEIGFYGSDAYTKTAKTDGDRIIGGCINFDMIGYSPDSAARTLYIHYSPNPAANKTFAELFKKTAANYTNLNVQLHTGSDFHSSSDQYCFWKNGYAAVLGIEAKGYGGLCPDYHRAGDTLDGPKGLNDSELMTKSTKAAVAVLADLAMPLATSSLPPDALEIKTALRIMKRGTGRGMQLSLTVTGDRAPATIAIYSARGKRIAVMAENGVTDGTYTLAWPGAQQASGLYVVDVQRNDRHQSQTFFIP